jgi:multicomponent Na+:H+ antiporter subunit G
MSKQVLIDVLASLATLIILLSAAGALVVRSPLARLHFLSPVTSLAAPVLGVALVLQLGWGIASGLVVFTIGLLAASSPVLESAIARLIGLTEGILPERDADEDEASATAPARGRTRMSSEGAS